MPFYSKSKTRTSIVARASEISSISAASSDLASTVRVVTSKDYKAAATCLCNAFDKDEVAAYFYDCPDTADWSAERKWALHCAVFEAMTYAHLKFGAVYAIGELKDGSYDAATLWMPPGTNMHGYLRSIMNGLMWKVLRLSKKLSKEGRTRLFRELVPLLESTKANVLKDRDSNSWYLVYIGTHSRARGKGLSKRLFAEVTKQADANGQACYLESSNTVNVSIYRKIGFEICKQITLNRGPEKINLDIMVREPVVSEESISTGLANGHTQSQIVQT